MFTSEMPSILSTCTSMPTGMADPTEQKTKYICMQDNSNAFDNNLERNASVAPTERANGAQNVTLILFVPSLINSGPLNGQHSKPGFTSQSSSIM